MMVRDILYAFCISIAVITIGGCYFMDQGVKASDPMGLILCVGTIFIAFFAMVLAFLSRKR